MLRALIYFSSFWPSALTLLYSFWKAEKDLPPSVLFRTFWSVQIRKILRLPSDDILHASDIKPSQVTLPYEELSRNSWRELLFEGSYLSYLRSHPDGWTIVSISELLPLAVLAIPLFPHNHLFISFWDVWSLEVEGMKCRFSGSIGKSLSLRLNHCWWAQHKRKILKKKGVLLPLAHLSSCVLMHLVLVSLFSSMNLLLRWCLSPLLYFTILLMPGLASSLWILLVQCEDRCR